MISYYPQPLRDKGHWPGVPSPGCQSQFHSANPTSNFGQHFDVPQLPTVLALHLSAVLSMYIVGCSQSHKSAREALNRIYDLLLLIFADLFWEIDYWVFDTKMVYHQEHLLMPADNAELHSQVSKFLQPSSNWHQIILANESLQIRFPSSTSSLLHK